MKELQSGLSMFESVQSTATLAERAHTRALASPAQPQGSPQCTKRATVGLLQLYKSCNPNFAYTPELNPRRQLTKPAEPACNHSRDNVNGDLIISVGDVFGIRSVPSQQRQPPQQHAEAGASSGGTGAQYVVKDLLGQGTFGQVVRCAVAPSSPTDGSAVQQVAMKVIKSQRAYYHQARVEVNILNELLHKSSSERGVQHIVRMLDSFVHANHLCIAFEQLGMNLYELIKQNHFRGVSLKLVRAFVSQLLKALGLLRKYSIVHCDVKPENVLIASVETGAVKLIDFGSACFEGRTVYTYIQSRFYRSPEVLLGCAYGCPIDAWSIGCVAAELFLGLPVFPGASELNMLHRITEALGPVPQEVLQRGNKVRKFYKQEVRGAPFELMSPAEYEQVHNEKPAQGKRYFRHSRLTDLVHSVSYKRTADDSSSRREYDRRNAFANFLQGLLCMDSAFRWTPDQALRHPFITGQKITQTFAPPAPELKANDFASQAHPSQKQPRPPMVFQNQEAQHRADMNELSRSMPMQIGDTTMATTGAYASPMAPPQPNMPSSMQGEYGIFPSSNAEPMLTGDHADHGATASAMGGTTEKATYAYGQNTSQTSWDMQSPMSLSTATVEHMPVHEQHALAAQSSAIATAAEAMAAKAAAQQQNVDFTAMQNSPQVPNGHAVPRYIPRTNGSHSTSGSGSSSGHYGYIPLQSPRTPSGMENMAGASVSLGASADSGTFFDESSPLRQHRSSHYSLGYQTDSAGERASPHPAEWDPNFSDQQLLHEEDAALSHVPGRTEAEPYLHAGGQPVFVDTITDTWRNQQQLHLSRGQGIGDAYSEGQSPPESGMQKSFSSPAMQSKGGQLSALTMALSQQQQQQQQQEEPTNDGRFVRRRFGNADVHTSSNSSTDAANDGTHLGS